MKFICTLTLGIALVVGFLEGASRAQTRIGENMISTNECFAKGGIGIIDAHVYVDLTSPKQRVDCRWRSMGGQGPRGVPRW